MTKLSRATFKAVGDRDAFTVMFNPASLKVTRTNKLQDDKNGGAQSGKAKQSTQGTTTKLEMELVYDTTEDGADVGIGLLGGLRELAQSKKGANTAPPQVIFRWGTFAFKGVIESLNETLDFWSSEGVPLRATVQLTMQGLEPTGKDAPPLIFATLNDIKAGALGATGLAASAGEPRAGRPIAAANGLEDMRMPDGGELTVTPTVELKPPAAFSVGDDAGASASAGASIGFGAGAVAGASARAGVSVGAGAGIGVSAGAGFGASAGAGFGAGASAGFGASAGAGGRFGASATAGVSASAGAFAGLGASKTAISVALDPARLLPPPASISVGAGAQFDVTGRLVSGGSAGLSARVGGVRIL